MSWPAWVARGPDAHTSGYGLLGIRERVQLLEGTLQVESSSQSGTTITARFPAQRRPASANPDAPANGPHHDGAVPPHASARSIGINPV